MDGTAAGRGERAAQGVEASGQDDPRRRHLLVGMEEDRPFRQGNAGPFRADGRRGGRLVPSGQGRDGAGHRLPLAAHDAEDGGEKDAGRVRGGQPAVCYLPQDPRNSSLFAFGAQPIPPFPL